MFDVRIDPAPRSATGASSTKTQDYGVAGQTPFRYLAQQMKRTYDENGKEFYEKCAASGHFVPRKNTASWFRKSYWLG
jgi:hypothetical protein